MDGRAKRHLKVLGIFARLYHRDGKDGYLKDLPLVMAYLPSDGARYNRPQPLLNYARHIGSRGQAKRVTHLKSHDISSPRRSHAPLTDVYTQTVMKVAERR